MHNNKLYIFLFLLHLPRHWNKMCTNEKLSSKSWNKQGLGPLKTKESNIKISKKV